MKCIGCGTEIGDAAVCENCGFDSTPVKAVKEVKAVAVKVKHKKKGK